MNNKLIIIFTILLLILPTITAQVKVQLGSPYVNIEDLSEIEFTSHPDYYEFCSGDKVVIPVLINNQNNLSDTFHFEIDKKYAHLPVETTLLKGGKSVILPLTISPPLGLEENTTIVLDVITKKEGLKRSIILKTNIKKCYLFELKLDKEKDEICGCDKRSYTLLLQNSGQYFDIFTLNLVTPEWVNSTLTNETIELGQGEKKEIELNANPGCEERGIFNINAKAISEKTKTAKEDKLELNVLPKKECYNTLISANNINIDYFGKNIPVIIHNKGVKDATYVLSAEGIDWYMLSQTDFTLKKDQKKTVNLALHPSEDVVEGTYNIDIKAKSGGEEFVKSITVNLKGKSVILEKIKFYLNYLKYYIGLCVIIFIIVLSLIMLIRKRKERKVKKKTEEAVKKEKKVVKEEKVAKEVEKTKKNWLPLFVYTISLVLLLLIIYSTFKYRPYYERALNSISGLFTAYVIPYALYFKYLVIGIGITIIVVLMIDFFRKKPKRKKKIDKKRIIKPQEKVIEVKEVSKKVSRKKKPKLFEHIYLFLVILLFLGIIAYTIYRFSGKPLSIDKFILLKNLVMGYLGYFIAGVLILLALIIIIAFFRKKLEGRKIKAKKSTKKFVKNLIIIISGLVVLSGIIYSFFYYGLIDYIRDFFVMYYPYILMGVGVLTILILILHFQSKKIS